MAQSDLFIEDPREHGGRKDSEFFQSVIENPFVNEVAWDINFLSAQQCRKWADRVGNDTGVKRYVAGAIGPMTVSLNFMVDANDAAFRPITYDQVKAAYTHQIRALIAGGVDTLLVETIFDSLNAKAALAAIPDSLVDELVVHGSPEQCRATIQRYFDNGVTTTSLAILPLDPELKHWDAVKALAPNAG